MPQVSPHVLNWNAFENILTKIEKILQIKMTMTFAVHIDTPCFLFDARQLCMNGGACAAKNDLPGCV